MSLSLSSSSSSDSTPIPLRYTADGAYVSPPLSWQDPSRWHPKFRADR